MKWTREAVASAVAPLQKKVEAAQHQIDQLRTALNNSRREAREAQEAQEAAAAAAEGAAANGGGEASGAQIQELKEQLEHTNIQHDDLEQYGRRMHVRIEGLEFKEEETPDQLFDQVKTALHSVGVPVAAADVVRFHRSSRAVTRDGKLVKQTIIKFARWDHRRQAQFANKKARETNKGFRIHGDLTRRRHGLLLKAREMIDNRFQPAAGSAARDGAARAPFAYADVNCNLRVRRGEECHTFNTISELEAIVDSLAA